MVEWFLCKRKNDQFAPVVSSSLRVVDRVRTAIEEYEGH